MKKLIFLFSFTLIQQGTQAAYYFSMTANCRQAYDAVMCMRLGDAKMLLDKEKAANPQNATPYFIANYIDFFAAFIDETPVEFQKFKQEADKNLAVIEEADRHSPFFQYSQGQIYIQKSLVRFKFKEYASGAYELRKGFKLLEKNNVQYPQFKANLLFLGMMHCVIGTVPEDYRWIGSLVGLSGTTEQGMLELNTLAKVSQNASEYDFVYPEAMLTLALMDTYLQRDPVSAKKVLAQLTQTFIQPSLLVTYLNAATAIHSSSAEEVISVLAKKPTGIDFYPIHYTDYQMGQAKLARLDKDAQVYFLKYLKEFKGESFVKAAYQKIAWSYLVQGDVANYRTYIQLCLKNGFANTDEDKQALVEAKSGEIPNVVLLTARLLFDGGYYNKALATLSVISLEKLTKPKDKLEYSYRQARIYDRLGNTDKAIPLYEETIRNGESMTYYFAANSALEMGMLYEKLKNKEKAKSCFQKCLSMRNHEYQNGLDQKAKAGLGRVK